MSNTKKTFLRVIDTIKRAHLRIYLIILGFSAVFFLMLKGASGHKFVFTDEEWLYALLYGIIFLLSYGYKLRKKLPNLLRYGILSLFLLSSLVTLILDLQLLHFAINFDFEPSAILVILVVMYILPLLFLLCNFFLTKSLFTEIFKKDSGS